MALAVPTYPSPNTSIFIKYKLVHLSLGTIIIFGIILDKKKGAPAPYLNIFNVNNELKTF